MNIINALLISLFASFSTCLGCVFLFVKIKSQNINKFITFSLSFSIAIMIGISIFDLLPSSIFIIINRYKIWSILLFSLLFLCSYYLIKYISNLLSKYENNLYKLGIKLHIPAYNTLCSEQILTSICWLSTKSFYGYAVPRLPQDC